MDFMSKDTKTLRMRSYFCRMSSKFIIEAVVDSLEAALAAEAAGADRSDRRAEHIAEGQRCLL